MEAKFLKIMFNTYKKDILLKSANVAESKHKNNDTVGCCFPDSGLFYQVQYRKKHIKMMKTMALLGFSWINYIETVQLESTLLFNKYYLTIITS